MLSTAESRIRAAGDRVSQAVQATVKEYGEISVKEAAEVIGVSRRQVYNLAKSGGVVFHKGRRPFLAAETSAA